MRSQGMGGKFRDVICAGGITYWLRLSGGTSVPTRGGCGVCWGSHLMVVLYPNARVAERMQDNADLGQDERRAGSGVYQGVVDAWETEREGRLSDAK
jgi:hypothetical protein